MHDFTHSKAVYSPNFNDALEEKNKQKTTIWDIEKEQSFYIILLCYSGFQGMPLSRR